MSKNFMLFTVLSGCILSVLLGLSFCSQAEKTATVRVNTPLPPKNPDEVDLTKFVGDWKIINYTHRRFDPFLGDTINIASGTGFIRYTTEDVINEDDDTILRHGQTTEFTVMDIGLCSVSKRPYIIYKLTSTLTSDPTDIQNGWMLFTLDDTDDKTMILLRSDVVNTKEELLLGEDNKVNLEMTTTQRYAEKSK